MSKELGENKNPQSETIVPIFCKENSLPPLGKRLEENYNKLVQLNEYGSILQDGVAMDELAKTRNTLSNMEGLLNS